jgi:hypothetical protein
VLHSGRLKPWPQMSNEIETERHFSLHQSRTKYDRKKFYEIGSRVDGDMSWSLALKRSPASGYTLAGSRLGNKYETGVKVRGTLAYYGP